MKVNSKIPLQMLRHERGFAVVVSEQVLSELFPRSSRPVSGHRSGAHRARRSPCHLDQDKVKSFLTV